MCVLLGRVGDKLLLILWKRPLRLLPIGHAVPVYRMLEFPIFLFLSNIFLVEIKKSTMNVLARVTGFTPQISATVHCVPTSNRKTLVEFVKQAEKIIFEPRPAVSGSCRLAKAYLSPTGWVNPRATVGLTCKPHCLRRITKFLTSSPRSP